MVEIESPLGKKVYANPSQRQVYTVSDPNQDLTSGGSFTEPTQSREPVEMSMEEIAKLEKMRNNAYTNKNKASPEARSRIEFLSGIGRMEESLEIDGTKFTLQSIKSREQEEVFDFVSKLGEISAIRLQFEIRAQTLARAIFAINDQPFGIVIGSNSIDDKVNTVRELDENIADYLYKWYQENIVKKAQSKYVVKTKEDAEEVIEAVKK